jgi:hypothetical protein
MRMRNACLIATMSAVVALTACAQSKKSTMAATNNNKEYVTLIESTKELTRHVKPQTEYHFVLRWESNTPPESFYWRETEGVQDCMIIKATKVRDVVNKKSAREHWYSSTAIVTDQIKKGDTLLLIPQRGGKYPVPDEIPASAQNTLFYKTASSNWMALPIKNIQ